MEPATHSLAAYMMSRAGLNRWCPCATPVLLLAANVPDIDFLARFGDDLFLLDWRRGPTHALPFAPLMAALPLLPMLLFARKRMQWRKAYFLSVLGVLSHLLLDWTNIYGARLLEPFNRVYYHLDITGATDLWMLLVMAAAAAWFGLSKLVSSEIGSAKATGRGVAIAALLFVVLWQGVRYFAHERVLAVLDSRIYDGAAPTRVAALPHFTSPLHWTGIVETGAAYRVFEISLTGEEFDPAAGRTFYKPEPSRWLETAKQTDTFRRLLRFAPHALWQVIPAGEPEGAMRVLAMDVRFGLPGEERFVATAIIDRSGHVVRHWFQFSAPGEPPRFR